MYRRRRLVLLLIVLAVVIGVVLAVWQPWRGAASPDTGRTPSAPATSPTAPETAPTPEAPTQTPAAPEPSASATEPVIATCSTADLTVLAVTDKDSYGSGELPQLSMTLSNTSQSPCVINVGTATQSFVITSGSDTWWRSTDCQTESSDQVVQLAPGQTVSSVTPIAWDRSRSAVDTCDRARPQAPAGYFHLQVSIGGIQGADTRMFRLR